MFADEFEEFRARSYSGGFSARRHGRPPQHRSRTTDHLTDPICPSTSFEPNFPDTPFQHLQLDAPMSAPIRWASQETSAGRFRQVTNLSRNRNGMSSRLLEVTVTRRKDDSNGNWRPGEMRPRLNSAPQRRSNLITQPRRQALVAETPTSERHSPDLTSLSYPMRKIRSFIGLGKKCLLGDEDLHAVNFFKDHGATNGHSPHHNYHLLHHHHRHWKAADDLRCQKPTNNFRFVKRPDPFSWSTKTEVWRNRAAESADEERDIPDEYYRILFTGRRGVGKSTIVERLLNKKSIGFNKEFHPDHDAEGASCCPRQKSPSPLILGGDEANVVLNDLTAFEADGTMTSDDDVTGIVIVYSVEDRKSYELAIDRLYELRNDEGTGHKVAIILVANKVDLVRTRVISEQEGKSTAKSYDCKYIEVSAAIDHQIDDLFVGVLHQVRLVSLQRRQQQVLARGVSCSPMRTTRRWMPLERNESLEHRQNSDTCCLLAAREKVLAKLFTGQRRASKSCINLFEI